MASCHRVWTFKWAAFTAFLEMFVIASLVQAIDTNESLTATSTPMFLYSPGYTSNLNYNPNMLYDYYIESNSPGDTLTLTLIDCDIESGPGGDCVSDQLSIYDGADSSASLLEIFCCPNATYKPVWQTTGHMAYLMFATDAANEYKGFKIEVLAEPVNVVPDETLTATTAPSFLYSPGYIYNLDYGANVFYDYFVETHYPGHTIKMSMLDCDIESDKNGNCFYDKLRIYNGANDTAPLMELFCCPNATYRPVWTTTGPVAYLSFTTDANNEFKGFKIEILSDGITTTTTTTSTTTTTTTTTTTVTPLSTARNNATDGPENGGDGSDSSTAIIAGAAIGGLIFLGLIALLIVCLLIKSKRPRSADSEHVTKRVLWSRSGTPVTKVVPINESKHGMPPGTVEQRNIFDLDLPSAGGKANRLPPISPPLSSLLSPAVK